MVEVKSRAEWRRWLERHHEQKESIWVVAYRKHCTSSYVPYDEIVEEALCFGWIDSVRRKLDDDRTMLRLRRVALMLAAIPALTKPFERSA